MKSLVEELRAGAELEETYDADGIIRTGYQPSLRWRAATEIERLRGIISDVLNIAEKWPGDPLRSIIEPVREALGE